MNIRKDSRVEHLSPFTPRPGNCHAVDSRVCHRGSSPPRLFRSLAAFAVATVLMTGLMTAGLNGQPAKASEAAGAGHFDFFRTVAKRTEFQFKGDYAIPAGFFSEGSSRFEGTVFFSGDPLGSFRDHRVGNADTIMERKNGLQPGQPFPSSEKTQIELVALSMKSTLPIQVRVGRETELWDVKVGLSSSQASTGTLTITRRSPKGGVASSEMTVYPLFTFERRKDKAEKRLDLGVLKLPPLTLRASNFPWATECPKNVLKVPGLSDDFCAGVRGNGGGATLIDIPHCDIVTTATHCHGVMLAF
jgi:hypothetical protein